MKNRLCPAEEILGEYLSGTLSGKEKETLEKHLASCGKCRLLLAEAHEVLRMPALNELTDKCGRWVLRNRWLVAAAAAFIASLCVPGYFLQLVAVGVLAGIKWIVEARTSKMLITIREAYRQEDTDGRLSSSENGNNSRPLPRPGSREDQ